MTGISGFRPADLPVLPTSSTSGINAAADTRAYEINVPGPIPDTEKMSSEEVYDLFAGYVDDYGPQEAKDALASGQKIELRVHAEGRPGVEWDVELDPRTGTGTASRVSSNETVSHGAAGTNDPTCAVGVDPPPGRDRWVDGQQKPDLPPFLAHVLKHDGE